MQELPADWSALCAIVLLLGMRHGLDADHLAAIDGLTRLSARERCGARGGASRWCGVLFSLGHGLVVMGTAATLGLLSRHWTPPHWVDAAGAWISIFFLALLGAANLRAAWVAPPHAPVALVAPRSALLGRLVRGGGPAGALALGALFALSFDTLSQAALFSITAARFGGVTHSLALGALFVLGMLATDGLNGWWVARMVARADRAAAFASRAMSAAVGGASLLVAGLGAARLLWPRVDAWSEDAGLAPAAAVAAIVAFGALAALASRRLRAVRA